MKKNGVFLFVISHLVPDIFKIFVLCKLGTDEVIRCDNMEVKTQNREYLIRLFFNTSIFHFIAMLFTCMSGGSVAECFGAP